MSWGQHGPPDKKRTLSSDGGHKSINKLGWKEEEKGLLGAALDSNETAHAPTKKLRNTLSEDVPADVQNTNVRSGCQQVVQVYLVT